GDHEHGRTDLAHVAVLQIAIAHAPRAAVTRGRLDLQHLVQRKDLGAMALGAGDIRDVDGVARVDRAADVAAAEGLAALLEGAADARAGHDGDVLHDPQVEEAARVVARVKEHPRRLLGPVGEVAGPEAPAALEHAHAPAVLGKPAGGDPAAEPGPDHHGVVGG